MAKDQKVTLTFDMTDNTRKTVAFTVPAGKDGTNADGETPDAAINWHKFVWVPNDFVPPGILPLDKNSTTEDIRNRVNQLAEVMAAAGLVNINSPV